MIDSNCNVCYQKSLFRNQGFIQKLKIIQIEYN